MYKNVLQNIENIAIWPMVSFIIFFVFFLCLLLYVFTVDKKHIKKMENLPLEGDDLKNETNLTIGL